MAIRRYTLKSTNLAPSFRIDYQGSLNSEQLAVVEAPRTPALVIAGAGSGKTRTLIFRVARLIEMGLPPESILLLTFTNKSSQQMLRRVKELCGGLVDTRRMTGGTFHHVAHAILREFASALGYSERFTLLDREDIRDLLTACIADQKLEVGGRRFPKAEVMADLYSAAVNTDRSLEEVVAARRPQFLQLIEPMVAVAKRFVERKQKMQVFDFDDLLVFLKILLMEKPSVRAILQERFRAILVDEYQDTNRIQGEIVDLLAAGHQNLTVVGDDAQSIYRFRGADFTNILEFPARYPNCLLYKLTQNYRSVPQILQLANASIACNQRQFPKELFSTRNEGLKPVVVPLRDVYQQAEFVAQRILEMRDEGIPLREQAVLYRAHHNSMEIQLELTRRGIPFVVRSGVRFLEQAHIKDILAYLRYVHNPMDELAFKRVLRLYSGIGCKVADDLWAILLSLGRQAKGRQANNWEALGEQEIVRKLPKRARSGVERLAKTLVKIGDIQNKTGEIILSILSDGYDDYLKEHFRNGDARVEDVQQMAEYAAGFASLDEFLSEVLLLSDLKSEEVVEGREPDESVILSSIHQAKGLEWKAVFVVWLADGHFPLSLSLRKAEEEEEERRLFYVAVTRARDELYLTYPLTLALRDNERKLLRISRFLEELSCREPLFDRLQVELEPVAISAPNAFPRLSGS